MEHRETFCPHCQSNASVIAFKRDDPILSCGHVLDIESQYEREEMGHLLDFAMISRKTQQKTFLGKISVFLTDFKVRLRLAFFQKPYSFSAD